MSTLVLTSKPVTAPVARFCPNCPNKVPVVSPELVKRIVERLSPAERLVACNRAALWILTRHPGLTVYEGVHGRAYHPDEQLMIALEVGIVAETPCPFHSEMGCCLGGCATQREWAREPSVGHYLFLPNGILRLLEGPAVVRMLARHVIADAKTAGLTRTSGFAKFGLPTPEGALTLPSADEKSETLTEKDEVVSDDSFPTHVPTGGA